MSSTPTPSGMLHNAQTVLIIGSGVFGSSIALELKQRYTHLQVTICDAGDIPNTYCSSYDNNRIVRPDYGSDLLFTKLSLEGISAWKQFNARHTQVYHENGFLVCRSTPMHADSYEQLSYDTLKSLHVDVEMLDEQRIQQKFGEYNRHARKQLTGYINRTAGWVDPGAALTLFHQDCIAAGVQMRPQTFIKELIYSDDSQTRVIGARTADGCELHADVVVAACGSWTLKLLPELEGTVVPSAQAAVYYDIGDLKHNFNEVVAADLQDEGWYYFPVHKQTIKIGRHAAGLSQYHDPTVWNTLHVPPETVTEFEAFVADWLPELQKHGKLVDNRICWYLDSCDGDFICDEHRSKKGLFIATAGNGTGFKHLPVIGKYLVALMEGRRDDVMPGMRQRWRYRLRSELSEDEMKPDACRPQPPLRGTQNSEAFWPKS